MSRHFHPPKSVASVRVLWINDVFKPLWLDEPQPRFCRAPQSSNRQRALSDKELINDLQKIGKSFWDTGPGFSSDFIRQALKASAQYGPVEKRRNRPADENNWAASWGRLALEIWANRRVMQAVEVFGEPGEGMAQVVAEVGYEAAAFEHQIQQWERTFPTEFSRLRAVSYMPYSGPLPSIGGFHRNVAELYASVDAAGKRGMSISQYRQSRVAKEMHRFRMVVRYSVPELAGSNDALGLNLSTRQWAHYALAQDWLAEISLRECLECGIPFRGRPNKLRHPACRKIASKRKVACRS